jgi:DNA-binding transcriptional regulator YbjK
MLRFLVRSLSVLLLGIVTGMPSVYAVEPRDADTHAPRPTSVPKDLDDLGEDFVKQREEMKVRFDAARKDIDQKRRVIREVFTNAPSSSVSWKERPLLRSLVDRLSKTHSEDTQETLYEDIRAEFKARLEQRREVMRAHTRERKSELHTRLDPRSY